MWYKYTKEDPRYSFQIIHHLWGFPWMGVPKWMVYRENPNPKWMITTGTPILGNLHIYAHQSKILSYPRVFHFYGNFPYEPSILGYPHFRNPYIYIYMNSAPAHHRISTSLQETRIYQQNHTISNWGTPKWMVYFRENPSRSGWFWSTPNLGNLLVRTRITWIISGWLMGWFFFKPGNVNSEWINP